MEPSASSAAVPPATGSTATGPPTTGHLHFVTGKLAQRALREVLGELAPRLNLQYSISVLPITVAALMTPRWLLRHLVVPAEATAVIVPGHLAEGRAAIEASLGVPVVCGPRDLRQLPEFFGAAAPQAEVLERHSIEIIAEINHAPRLPLAELLARARQLRDCGADVIDIGCEPGERWARIGEAFSALTAEGFTTSVDSLDPWEAAQACRHGAALVLSVNRSNRRAAVDWGTEVVVIPDTPDDLESLDDSVQWLASRGVPMRLDPILEPIGLGFAASLARYAAVRQRYPERELMMGIGNLTELTDVDSAGVNFLLLAICQELSIRSVLTTEVINWARSSVRECDLARRLVHYSVTHRLPPKRLSDALVMLRDPRLRPFSAAVLDELAGQLRDNNYRIFAQDGQIHLISAGLHLREEDPFLLFEQLMQRPQAQNVDAAHAFYLGFEMAKAVTALTLGKQYEQDQALRWGHLTREERHHRLQRQKRSQRQGEPPPGPSA